MDEKNCNCCACQYATPPWWVTMGFVPPTNNMQTNRIPFPDNSAPPATQNTPTVSIPAPGTQHAPPVSVVPPPVHPVTISPSSPTTGGNNNHGQSNGGIGGIIGTAGNILGEITKPVKAVGDIVGDVIDPIGSILGKLF